VRANREAWLKAHPAEAAKQAQHDQFVKSQLPLFFELGAAVKSGTPKKLSRSESRWPQLVKNGCCKPDSSLKALKFRRQLQVSDRNKW